MRFDKFQKKPRMYCKAKTEEWLFAQKILDQSMYSSAYSLHVDKLPSIPTDKYFQENISAQAHKKFNRHILFFHWKAKKFGHFKFNLML